MNQQAYTCCWILIDIDTGWPRKSIPLLELLGGNLGVHKMLRYHISRFPMKNLKNSEKYFQRFINRKKTSWGWAVQSSVQAEVKLFYFRLKDDSSL